MIPKTSNKLSFAALAVSILALSISGSQALIALKTMNRSFEASVLQHRIAESKTIAAIQAAAVLDAEIRVSVALRDGDRASGIKGVDWAKATPLSGEIFKAHIDKRHVAGSDAASYINTITHIYDREMRRMLFRVRDALVTIIQATTLRNEVQSFIVNSSLRSIVERCGGSGARYSIFTSSSTLNRGA